MLELGEYREAATEMGWHRAAQMSDLAPQPHRIGTSQRGALAGWLRASCASCDEGARENVGTARMIQRVACSRSGCPVIGPEARPPRGKVCMPERENLPEIKIGTVRTRIPLRLRSLRP
jgi:hypothetical protein